MRTYRWILVIACAVACHGQDNSTIALSNRGTGYAATIDSARLGDRGSQQQFVCEFYSTDRQQMQAMAENDIFRIGGWFAIQFYRELLSPQARMRYLSAKKEPDSQPKPVTEPRLWALAALPKLAPNPPVGAIDGSASPEELQRYAQIWRDWIQANQPTLQKLQPTGGGVDFTGKSCRRSAIVPKAAARHP